MMKFYRDFADSPTIFFDKAPVTFFGKMSVLTVVINWGILVFPNFFFSAASSLLIETENAIKRHPISHF